MANLAVDLGKPKWCSGRSKASEDWAVEAWDNGADW